MASTAKASGPKSDSPEPMPFETALKKLVSIVETMEEGDLPLEALLEKYEEGTRLVTACQAKLKEAEVKIKKLEKTASGETVLQPLNAEALQDDE